MIADPKILVVDADPSRLETVVGIIGENYTTIPATSEDQAMELIESQRPDVIVGGSPAVTLENISTNLARTHDQIPAVLYNGEVDQEEIARLGEIAPIIYVPILDTDDPTLFLSYVANQLFMAGTIQQSMTDELTQLPNRRGFIPGLEKRMAVARRNETPLSVALFDLNDFKHGINDRYGHPTGDRTLIKFAGILIETIRPTDLPSRFGGDEYALAMGATYEQAQMIVGRISEMARDSPVDIVGGGTLNFSTSFGIAQYTPKEMPTAESFLQAADEALYAHKATQEETRFRADSR